MVLTLASFFVSLLAILFVLICLFMMLVILIQKPKGGGLSGAFGGAGGGEQSVLGAKAGDVLTWVTITCFVMFLLLAVGLTWTIQPTKLPTAPSNIQQTGGGTGAETTVPQGDGEDTPTSDSNAAAPAANTDVPQRDDPPAPYDNPGTDAGAQP